MLKQIEFYGILKARVGFTLVCFYLNSRKHIFSFAVLNIILIFVTGKCTNILQICGGEELEPADAAQLQGIQETEGEVGHVCCHRMTDSRVLHLRPPEPNAARQFGA